MFNTIQTTQTTQTPYLQRRKKSEIDSAHQKQRKELILTDNKNIFTLRLQPIQPNFITDDITKFMEHQKQRKQLILTNDNNIFTFPTTAT